MTYKLRVINCMVFFLKNFRMLSFWIKCTLTKNNNVHEDTSFILLYMSSY